ncbi:acyltransferase family protein [Desulfobacter postgatei]|jgi:peptidoglycan/LPS O-acetylase OafA/YrhL|uniref:acyltransferase family protein n=1 Tax=Desulfobacter postgatei TaxID=2293 RepID=UPI002A3636ED|nr:acyltransferase family protein [Desulfobacter postgatei]MDX9964219.1 acyltransferase family protein [Desulfobacter postgatei]
MNLSSYSHSRDNNFNLIRFIAAFLVLFGHSFPIVNGPKLVEPLQNAIHMTWGAIAVDIFFVISGFLIAGSFFSRKKIIVFLWARILRIYPALIINILFCVFVVGLFFTNIPATDYLAQTGTYKYLIRNVTLLWGGVNHHLPGVFIDNPVAKAVNGSLWTLPYEIKMYGLLLITAVSVVFFQNKTRHELQKTVFFSIAFLSFSVHILNHFFQFAPGQFLRLLTFFFMGSAFYVFKDNIILSKKIWGYAS